MTKEKNPLITVIIPAYNSEKYIGRCLESILGQSFEDFEILVIDDGSTDKTGEVVKKYVAHDDRIIYKKQKNMGVAKTRNKAVKMARGEFVAFIDNDDFIDKDYLEKLLPRKGEDVVISGYRRPDEKGNIVAQMQLTNTNWSKFMIPTPWAKIYRKDFIINNRIEFLDNNIGEDIYFNLVAMLLARDVRIVNYVGYNWFYNRESISSTKHKSFDKVDIFKLLNSCYDELIKRKLLEKNYWLIEFFFYRFIIWFLLYAAKGEKKTEIDKVYEKLFDWLKKRFPDYRKNKLLKGRLSGEVRTTRLAYKIFLMFQRVGLGKALVWAYAKM